MMIKDRNVYIQAGAGIVYDSQPTFEYEETLSKLRGAMRVIQKAGDVAIGSGFSTEKTSEEADNNDLQEESQANFKRRKVE
eukprot:g2161.t1